MSVYVDFLKIQYRMNKVSDSDLENRYSPKGFKSNNKLTTDEKNEIKATKLPKKVKK